LFVFLFNCFHLNEVDGEKCVERVVFEKRASSTVRNLTTPTEKGEKGN
jgi:hypothetical protein